MHDSKICERFVDYFCTQHFQLLPRASMLHPSIPMSFVMSAGLVQVETSLSHVTHRQGNNFVLVQECFRHFDLAAIGTDNQHLSLFVMPAAFMFGAHSHQTAIKHIWTVATQILGIDPSHLWVSYFSGDLVEGHDLPEDFQTYKAWQSVGLAQERIIRLGRQHNYWVQGGGIDDESHAVFRKAGANTELFYDTGYEFACGPDCKPGCRCGRFVEISNTLFVSHAFDPRNNTIHPLSTPFTEIVIGAERVAMILQQVSSVFDITPYIKIIHAIRQFTSVTEIESDLLCASERVIADHLRALYVLVADGAPAPGKDGRARIMKLLIRSVMTRQLLLGIPSQVFLPFITHKIADVFDENDPKNRAKAVDTLCSYFEYEGSRFLKTLERGRRQIEALIRTSRSYLLTNQQMLELEKKWGIPMLLIHKFLQEYLPDSREKTCTIPYVSPKKYQQ